jgi:hypothetical protein
VNAVLATCESGAVRSMFSSSSDTTGLASAERGGSAPTGSVSRLESVDDDVTAAALSERASLDAMLLSPAEATFAAAVSQLMRTAEATSNAEMEARDWARSRSSSLIGDRSRGIEAPAPFSLADVCAAIDQLSSSEKPAKKRSDASASTSHHNTTGLVDPAVAAAVAAALHTDDDSSSEDSPDVTPAAVDAALSRLIIPGHVESALASAQSAVATARNAVDSLLRAVTVADAVLQLGLGDECMLAVAELYGADGASEWMQVHHRAHLSSASNGPDASPTVAGGLTLSSDLTLGSSTVGGAEIDASLGDADAALSAASSYLQRMKALAQHRRVAFRDARRSRIVLVAANRAMAFFNRRLAKIKSFVGDSNSVGVVRGNSSPRVPSSSTIAAVERALATASVHVEAAQAATQSLASGVVTSSLPVTDAAHTASDSVHPPAVPLDKAVVVACIAAARAVRLASDVLDAETTRARAATVSSAPRPARIPASTGVTMRRGRSANPVSLSAKLRTPPQLQPPPPARRRSPSPLSSKQQQRHVNHPHINFHDVSHVDPAAADHLDGLDFARRNHVEHLQKQQRDRPAMLAGSSASVLQRHGAALSRLGSSMGLRYYFPSAAPAPAAEGGPHHPHVHFGSADIVTAGESEAHAARQAAPSADSSTQGSQPAAPSIETQSQRKPLLSHKMAQLAAARGALMQTLQAYAATGVKGLPAPPAHPAVDDEATPADGEDSGERYAQPKQLPAAPPPPPTDAADGVPGPVARMLRLMEASAGPAPAGQGLGRTHFQPGGLAGFLRGAAVSSQPSAGSRSGGGGAGGGAGRDTQSMQSALIAARLRRFHGRRESLASADDDDSQSGSAVGRERGGPTPTSPEGTPAADALASGSLPSPHPRAPHHPRSASVGSGSGAGMAAQQQQQQSPQHRGPRPLPVADAGLSPAAEAHPREPRAFLLSAHERRGTSSPPTVHAAAAAAVASAGAAGGARPRPRPAGGAPLLPSSSRLAAGSSSTRGAALQSYRSPAVQAVFGGGGGVSARLPLPQRRQLAQQQPQSTSQQSAAASTPGGSAADLRTPERGATALEFPADVDGGAGAAPSPSAAASAGIVPRLDLQQQQQQREEESSTGLGSLFDAAVRRFGRGLQVVPRRSWLLLCPSGDASTPSSPSLPQGHGQQGARQGCDVLSRALH